MFYRQNRPTSSRHATRLVNKMGLISPDTGISHMANAYGVRQIMLETRERLENQRSPVYIPINRVFRHDNPPCSRDCIARALLKTHGSALYDERPHVNATKYDQLSCKSYAEAPCLDYSDKQLKELVGLAADLVGTTVPAECKRL